MSWTLQNDYLRYINAVTNVLLTLNSAVNFLIYCLVGKKFRRIFVAMVCSGSGCWRRRRFGGHSDGRCGDQDEAADGDGGAPAASRRPLGVDRGRLAALRQPVLTTTHSVMKILE